MTFTELEIENARQRAELCECRNALRESPTKLGTAAHLVGFPSDGTVGEIAEAIVASNKALHARGFGAGMKFPKPEWIP